MKYEVTTNYDIIDSDLTKRQAKAVAVAAAKDCPDDAIFVEWYRDSDGCRGYLNQDGNHAPTGTAWEAKKA